LKGVLDSGSKADMKLKPNELSEAMQKIGQAMYASQGQAGPHPGAQGGHNLAQNKDKTVHLQYPGEARWRGSCLN